MSAITKWASKWCFQPGESRNREARGEQWKRKHFTRALVNSKVTRLKRDY